MRVLNVRMCVQLHTQVAEGGGVGEAIPMLLKVPQLSYPQLGGYSMLGFGDVILPGSSRRSDGMCVCVCVCVCVCGGCG